MIRVRPAVTRDLSQIMEIASRSLTASQWSEKDYSKLLAPEASAGSMTLVIEEGNQFMGFLVGRQIAPAIPEWEIENFAVSPPSRRRGLGSRLLGEFLRIVGERGSRAVFLEVRESNRAARALYERLAFAEAGRRKSYYEQPEEDAVILKFSFPQPR